MSRSIDADKLKEVLEKNFGHTGGASVLAQLIDAQPTTEPKRGHWIKADVCGGTTSWECSCCHNWTGLPTGWNVNAKLWFCPKCGADMRTERRNNAELD